MNFKEIHIGKLIKIKVEELNLNEERITNFFKLSPAEIQLMYDQDDISAEYLLRWCKLLEYDFFRLYSHHLILYAPPSKSVNSKEGIGSSSLPVFRKNIYSRELIRFVLEQIESEEMTRSQVVLEYRIPKSTLNKWILKYSERKPALETV